VHTCAVCVCMCMCVCVCVCKCVGVYAFVCAHVCVCACMSTPRHGVCTQGSVLGPSKPREQAGCHGGNEPPLDSLPSRTKWVPYWDTTTTIAMMLQPQHACRSPSGVEPTPPQAPPPPTSRTAAAQTSPSSALCTSAACPPAPEGRGGLGLGLG